MLSPSSSTQSPTAALKSGRILKIPYSESSSDCVPLPPSTNTNTNTNTNRNRESSVKIKSLIQNSIIARISRFLRALKSAIARAVDEMEFLHYLTTKKNKRSMIKYKKKILLGSFRLHYNWCSAPASSSLINLPNVPYSDFTASASAPSSASAITNIYDNNIFTTYSSSRRFFEEFLEMGSSISSKVHLQGRRLGVGGRGSSSLSFSSSEFCTWNSAFSSSSSGNDDSFRSATSTELDTVGTPTNQQLSNYLKWLDDNNKTKKLPPDHQADNKTMSEIDELADMFIANCHEKFRLEKIESYRRYQEMLARSM